MIKLKVVCAWCGKDIGEKDGQGQEGISHGMCDECYVKWREENPKPSPFSVKKQLEEEQKKKEAE